MAGGALHSSTLTWPTRDRDVGGAPRLGGWIITSPYGWRNNPFTGAVEFHNGIDIGSSDGQCPFGAHCEVTPPFDGIVSNIGWDSYRDPLVTGGGQTVTIINGDGEYEVTFAHLEPYRHYVRLEGRIDDPYGRYPEYADYQPIGEGELIPGAESVTIAIRCEAPSPTFALMESGATSVFAYDAPGRCTTSVTWSNRGDGWKGWIPDGATSVTWETQIQGDRTRSVALDAGARFRAWLRPPPPPPTPTPSGTPERAPIQPDDPPPLEGNAWSAPIAAAHRAPRVAIPALAPGQTCRPQPRAPCVWRVAPISASARDVRMESQSSGVGSSVHERLTVMTTRRGDATPRRMQGSGGASTGDPVLLYGVFDASPTVPPGATVGLRLLASSPKIPFSVSAEGGDGATVKNIAAYNNGACRSSGTVMECQAAAPDRLTIGTVVVQIAPNAVIGELVAVRITLQADGVSESVTVNIPIGAPPTPPPQGYPPPGGDAPIVVVEPRPPGGGGGSGAVVCQSTTLQQVEGTQLPSGAAPHLASPALESFRRVRADVILSTGVDPFRRLADALRPPEFRSSKPGVARRSWHMTGRAIDVDIGYPWRRVADGPGYWRLYIGSVDITAIFERYGWRRIPDRADSTEWWHYEFREGLSWTAAMRQVWPLNRLQIAFPEIPWQTLGCADTLPDEPLIIGESIERCRIETPGFDSAVSYAPGCGPPIRLSMRVRQMTDRVGFVGRTGAVTGWHLHMTVIANGVRGPVMSYICNDSRLGGRPLPPGESCWTWTVDPLEALPRMIAADGGVDGAPYQLPPPDMVDAYWLGDRVPPSGMYWSPNRIDGPYGGRSWRDALEEWRREEGR